MIRPLDTYVDHEMMLDSYGIAYVCQHPEILFTPAYVPPADPFRRNGEPGLRRQDMAHTAYGRNRAPHIGGLALRAAEAYRILAELYAPYHPDHQGNGRL